jgi:hypothetical protein
MDTLIKLAELEETSVVDPITKRKVRVSTHVRIKYREYFRGQQDKYESSPRETLFQLRNKDLNEEIANDFIKGEVVHMFFSKETDFSARHIVWMEIRKQLRGPRAIFNFFISKINVHEGYVDILTVTQNYRKPNSGKSRIIKFHNLKNLFEKTSAKKIKTFEDLISHIHESGKSLKKPKIEINRALDIVTRFKKIEKKGKFPTKALKVLLPEWVELH